MKALTCKLTLNSLYSIRIPYTWQSALTYPVLPPSSVIGLIANALQRYKNDKHPKEYLNIIENNLLWAGSRLLSPSIIKSYNTSAIVKWKEKIGGKFTNALGRQFAYTRNFKIMAIFKDGNLIEDIITSLKTSPLTCGDSESPIFIEEVRINNVDENITENEIETEYPVPFTKDIQILSGRGQIFLMHERCMKLDNNFPLIAYLVPIEERYRIIYPSSIKLQLRDEKAVKVKDIGYIILKPRFHIQNRKMSKRKR